jgi:hypothetical protein
LVTKDPVHTLIVSIATSAAVLAIEVDYGVAAVILAVLYPMGAETIIGVGVPIDPRRQGNVRCADFVELISDIQIAF